MKHTWNHQDILDHAMITVRVDFETLARGQRLFKCRSELNLDDSYQNIICSKITGSTLLTANHIQRKGKARKYH